jgi:hypothetical protein
MNCNTCNDLFIVYKRAVLLYVAAVRDLKGVIGDNLALAPQEANRLRQACCDADDALTAHRRQEHKTLRQDKPLRTL